MQEVRKVSIYELAAITVAALPFVWTLYTYFMNPLVAVVECEHWKAPQTLAGKATNVNGLCSMYSVVIRNRGGAKALNPQMTIPSARCWEVRWTAPGNKGAQDYFGTTVIALPAIQSGEHINVTAWATCEGNRPNAHRVKITQDEGKPARLQVCSPALGPFHFLSRYTKTLPYYIFAIALGLVLICRRKLIRWK